MLITKILRTYPQRCSQDWNRQWTRTQRRHGVSVGLLSVLDVFLRAQIFGEDFRYQNTPLEVMVGFLIAEKSISVMEFCSFSVRKWRVLMDWLFFICQKKTLASFHEILSHWSHHCSSHHSDCGEINANKTSITKEITTVSDRWCRPERSLVCSEIHEVKKTIKNDPSFRAVNVDHKTKDLTFSLHKK